MKRFYSVINKAKITCENSSFQINNHFVHADKMVNLAKVAVIKNYDYNLNRYVCYLIIKNINYGKEKKINK